KIARVAATNVLRRYHHPVDVKFRNWQPHDLAIPTYCVSSAFGDPGFARDISSWYFGHPTASAVLTEFWPDIAVLLALLDKPWEEPCWAVTYDVQDFRPEQTKPPTVAQCTARRVAGVFAAFQPLLEQEAKVKDKKPLDYIGSFRVGHPQGSIPIGWDSRTYVL